MSRNIEFEKAFVIDDDGEVLEIVSVTLQERCGISQVETFGNPEWVLGRMGIIYPDIKPGSIKIPDLILTDFNYKHPSINGLDLIKEVQSRFSNLPIILMSGNLDELQNQITIFDLAATLQKPFRIAALVGAVEFAKIWKETRL